MAILLPTVCVGQVTDITPDMLRAMKVRALILDADNTLSGHGSQQPFEGWNGRSRWREAESA